MEHFSDLLVVLFTQYVSENLLNIKACFCLIMSLNPNWTCCECNVVSVTLTLCSSAGVNDLSNVSSTLSFKTGPALYFCKNWITNNNLKKNKQGKITGWLIVFALCCCWFWSKVTSAPASLSIIPIVHTYSQADNRQMRSRVRASLTSRGQMMVFYASVD